MKYMNGTCEENKHYTAVHSMHRDHHSWSVLPYIHYLAINHTACQSQASDILIT